ncbi:hypothetical protein H634G_08953 [Metarhizium anisopliae BRIP 53293]|uniref:Bys1 family protein n=1 Tax=Metarhizium anisopliae BRIP 53293 TaxID=1291518 RepID=A0A0D9NNS8_METAN|nr:hypothetical protein H634G_08953 [Metarhizium anisopliae BRIP 53293]KJK88475.1 hypothetical protein H633G_07635 [Metarhizium anisopliae BRIP 53284]
MLNLLALGFALAKAVLAIGNAVVENNCDFPVYLRSVGREVSPAFYLRPRGGRFSEPYSRDPTFGQALKITLGPDDVFDPTMPQTVYGYTLSEPFIYYDLDDVRGNIFAGKRLVQRSTDDSCPSNVWPQGVPVEPHVHNCRDSEADIILTLCSAERGLYYNIWEL